MMTKDDVSRRRRQTGCRLDQPRNLLAENGSRSVLSIEVVRGPFRACIPL
jgi:hypothetical protein